MSPAEYRQLIDDFGNATLQAGRVTSGIVLDADANRLWEKMQCLRSKLHALADVFRKSETPEND
jgi:hypothetical protein